MHRIMDRTDSPPPEVWHKWNMRETNVHHHSKRVLTHYPTYLSSNAELLYLSDLALLSSD
jgi:hypothetical protein